MKYRSVVFSKLPATAMALYPFIIFRNRAEMSSQLIIRHELIHFRQQLELLILPFYVFYLLNYVLNLVIHRNHDKAYRNIIFELEAYANEEHVNYLAQRKWFAWVKYWNAKPKAN